MSSHARGLDFPTGLNMANIVHQLRGRFDQPDINAIITLAKSNGLDFGDAITLELDPRTAETKRVEMQNLARQLIEAYDNGDITVANENGVIGTELNNWATTAHDGGAGNATGVDVADPLLPDEIWITDPDNASDKLWKVNKSDGTSVTSIAMVGTDLQGLAFNGTGGASGTLFLADNANNEIIILDIASTTTIKSIAYSSIPVNILDVFAVSVTPSGELWIACEPIPRIFHIMSRINALA